MKKEDPFAIWLRENADLLKEADRDGTFLAVQRTGEIFVASEDRVIWLCEHHTKLASVELKKYWAMAKREPDPSELIHRQGFMSGLIQSLRDRLYPVFSRPEIFDPEGRYKNKFNGWELKYSALVALAGYPPADDYKSYIDQFHSSFKEVEGIIDKMLAEFDCKAYSSLTI